MISLVLPKEGEDRYFNFGGIFYGPLDIDGTFRGEAVAFPSKLDAISGSRGILGENNVTHDSIVSDLLYHPLAYGLKPTAAAGYPDQVSIPIITYNGKKTYVKGQIGFARNNGVIRWYNTTNVYIYTFQRDLINPSLWIVYYLCVTRGTPSTISFLYVYRFYSVVKYSSYDQCTLDYTRETFVTRTGVPISFDPMTEKSSAKVIQAFSGWKSNGEGTHVKSTISWYQADLSANVMSISTMRDKIDLLVAEMGWDKEYPIPDMHYGDLAMQASAKVNANKVNMIAFLRDLRHPTEMIPKLRNLVHLKTLADNFLTVEYGILPTIGDIESIMGAFKRMGPYVDRNGFDVYTASHRDSLDIDAMSYQLEQHIKLAIADEDDEFLSLIARVESFGFLPTFKNLWDLIPYSFVLDWFIDVGEFLKRVDTNLRIMRLEIRYVTSSRKTITSGTLPVDPEIPFEGTIQWVHYQRWVSDQCPVPPLSLNTTFQEFSHWLESGALLAQRSKH